MKQQNKPHPACLSLADQVRAIALEGLKFAKDPYDKNRYEKLLHIATTEFSTALDLDFPNLLENFKRELGCMTPKLGVDVAVLNNKEQLLVLNRSDKTGWCLPCGWVDVGETPASAAVREVMEETTLKVEAAGYISISAKGPGQTQNIQHQINIIVFVKLLSDPLSVTLNHEHTDYKWISDNSHLQWHSGHDIQADRIFRFIKEGKRSILPIG